MELSPTFQVQLTQAQRFRREQADPRTFAGLASASDHYFHQPAFSDE